MHYSYKVILGCKDEKKWQKYKKTAFTVIYTAPWNMKLYTLEGNGTARWVVKHQVFVSLYNDDDSRQKSPKELPNLAQAPRN